LELQVYQRAAEPLLAPLIKYFEENPAPDWLAPLVEVAHVRPPILALATIAPVLDHIYQGQSRNDDDDDDDDEIDPREVGMLVKKDMGERLRSHLASKPMPKRLKADWKRLTDWDNEMRVRAGHWMMNAVPRIPSLRLNHLGAPEIVRARKIDVDALRDLMMRINQVFMPFTEEPPLDWTGFRKWYGGSFNRSFVRGVKGEHLDTKKLIHEAFESGFPHANERTVKDDVRVAKKLDGKTFWLDYNCDFRGRVYAVQHFNYMRGDHVRSLFKFANGIPLTENGLAWLEVHCANCEGSTDKESYGERQKWVAKNKDKILKIAADPDGTFDDFCIGGQPANGWREVDKPFAYVAACRELKAAWEDQKGFKSHLPIPLDGSCNGIQHLACLKQDADAAKLVNAQKELAPGWRLGLLSRSDQSCGRRAIIAWPPRSDGLRDTHRGPLHERGAPHEMDKPHRLSVRQPLPEAKCRANFHW
jgi:hypothetical protein